MEMGEEGFMQSSLQSDKQIKKQTCMHYLHGGGYNLLGRDEYYNNLVAQVCTTFTFL